MEIRFNSRKNCAIWGILSVIMTIFGLLVLILDPMDFFIKHMIKLREGSMAHDVWKEVPIEILLNAYIFNVTNPEDFLSGKDKKLKLKEIGPYVFKEKRENLNIRFNENGTMSYHPKTSCRFVLEKSIGNPKVDRVIIPNIPLLGILSATAKESIWRKASVKAFLWGVKPTPFLNLTVEEIMWGYDDRMVKLLNGFFSGWVDFSRFGVLDRVYADNTSFVTMNLDDTKSDMYSLQLWNGSPGLKEWGYVDENHSLPCNSLKGTYEGLLFPPNMQEGKPLRIFKKLFCRWLALEYRETIEIEHGVRGFRYELPKESFNCDRPGNVCFCPTNGTCLPDGLSDLTPCYYGMPAAMSFPHFYGGDKSLYDKVDGLKPDKSRHESHVVLQPDLGMPVKLSTRTQLNIVMNDISFMPALKSFSNMVLPMLWMDGIVDELPSYFTFRMALGARYLPLLQLYVGWGLIVLGLCLFVGKTIRFLFDNLQLSGVKSSRAMNYIHVATNEIGLKEEICDKN